MSIAEKFEVIADAVYEKGELIGYENGRNEGLEEGYADGRNQERIAVWEVFLNKGKAMSYAYAFYGAKWNDATYKPILDYSIVVSANCNSIFASSAITNTQIPIDISGETVGGNTASMFSGAGQLKTIERLIVKESNGYSNGFVGCKKLENITFEGVIGKSISFADSPLTLKSMKNVIEHLKDYSEDETNRGKYTLTFSDTCWGNLEASGTATDGDTWENYVIKRGWLIG